MTILKNKRHYMLCYGDIFDKYKSPDVMLRDGFEKQTSLYVILR